MMTFSQLKNFGLLAGRLGREKLNLVLQKCGINQVRYTSVAPPSLNIPEPKREKTTCTLIPGDGIGPELVNSVQEVFQAAKVPVEFETLLFSEIQPETSVPLEKMAESVTRNGVCLKGIVITPFQSRTDDLQSLNLKMRRRLDLFANVVHIQSIPGVETRQKDLDFIIIREQVEGEYSALEHECVSGVVECLKIVTNYNSRRIAKFAFDYATKLGRKKVTAVHKANIMKLGDGLFLESCRQIAKLYPKIEMNDMIIDNCTMQLVSNPYQFDVLVMPNLYGNIINNLGVGLIGGAGLVAGESYGTDIVMFEPGARHAYVKATGKDIANPTAILLCASNMLRHINLPNYAKTIQGAVKKVLKAGKIRTKDIGGNNKCSEFTREVITMLQA